MSSATKEVFGGSSYDIVAWGRGQRTLWFEMFGSYQGDWVLFACDPDGSMFYLYRGCYGSCSGCDSYQATFNDSPTRAECQEFIKDYPAFLEIPRDTLTGLVKDDDLLSVFPANHREGFDGVGITEVANECTVLAKLELGVALAAVDMFRTKNQEVRRRVWEALGVEQLLAELQPVEIDNDGTDRLIEVTVPDERAPHRYLHLQDSSTPRQYLLRVPPEMDDVRSAKAWSFGIDRDAYAPLIET